MSVEQPTTVLPKTYFLLLNINHFLKCSCFVSKVKRSKEKEQKQRGRKRKEREEKKEGFLHQSMVHSFPKYLLSVHGHSAATWLRLVFTGMEHHWHPYRLTEKRVATLPSDHCGPLVIIFRINTKHSCLCP